MNPVTQVWENVERSQGYYECRDVFPDPGVLRYVAPLKTPLPRVIERSSQSIVLENLQWIRIDMQIRLMKKRIEAGIPCQ